MKCLINFFDRFTRENQVKNSLNIIILFNKLLVLFFNTFE